MCLAHLDRAIWRIPANMKGTRNSTFPVALVLGVCPENVDSLESELPIPTGKTRADIHTQLSWGQVTSE